ncbi:MAG: hypothetical protein H0V72_16595 [Bradyrhizobium sp.]|nr:hypothetical protein [Bradyrhizobium sp.]
MAVLTIWIAVGMPFESFAISIAMLLFVFILPVSGLIGLLDSQFSTAIPLLLRAPLTALIGATAAIVLPRAVLGPMPQDLSMPLAIGGTLCAGLCSLLAHDYRSRKTEPGDTSGSPS